MQDNCGCDADDDRGSFRGNHFDYDSTSTEQLHRQPQLQQSPPRTKQASKRVSQQASNKERRTDNHEDDWEGFGFRALEARKLLQSRGIGKACILNPEHSAAPRALV